MELSVEAFDRICRACLSESGNMKSLMTIVDSGHKLLDLLVFTVNLTADLEDDLPKQVCGDCEALLHKANQFKRRCIKSETILKNLCQNTFDEYFVKHDIELSKNNDKSEVKSDCKEERKLFNLFSKSDIKKLDVNDGIPAVKKEVTTEFETEGYNDFDDREELSIPIELKQEKNEIKNKCTCGEEYASKDKFKEHLKICSKYVKQLKPKNKKCIKKHCPKKTYIPIKNELECPKCNISFNLVSKWTAHQEMHLSNDTSPLKKVEIRKFQCSICLRMYKAKKSLMRHIKRHSSTDNSKYTCTKCKREFKYKACLESHLITIHGNKTEVFPCELCGEKFSAQKSLEAHMDEHSKKKNVCPFCNKSFLMVCTLKDHLRIHTGEKPFLCSICGKGFSQKTNLGQHMRRHMGVKPYKCDTCNRGFVSRGELDSHNRTHTGAHPFICDECGNGFTTSSALVKHRRTHTGERPYACDLCPMKFAATGTLKNHRRTHTGERPYQCSNCEKSFVQRSDLISHIRCHTGERPFVCPHCGLGFRKAAAMKAHVKMHTREAQNVISLHGGLIMSNMQCDGQLNIA